MPAREAWQKRLAAFDRRAAPSSSAGCAGELPGRAWTRPSPASRRSSQPSQPTIATRKASELVLEVITRRAGAGLRLGRPDAVEQHQDEET